MLVARYKVLHFPVGNWVVSGVIYHRYIMTFYSYNDSVPLPQHIRHV